MCLKYFLKNVKNISEIMFETFEVQDIIEIKLRRSFLNCLRNIIS